MTDPRLLPSACHDGIGSPDCIAFAAQYLACTCPCQRFAYCLTAVSRACLGGSVDRYSFTVTDLHRLPPAGLPAHRGSMAGLCPPLPTLRRRPYGRQRTARGRCGSLLLHRSGLAPPTPCRSPGALRVLHAQPRSRVSLARLSRSWALRAKLQPA